MMEEVVKKYRKKPVTIEAIQIGTDPLVIHKFMPTHFTAEVNRPFGSMTVTIHTLEGDMSGVTGDYIIRGVKGEYYPCRKDIFEETYEEVK